MICCVGKMDTNAVAPGRDPMRSKDLVRHLRQVGRYLFADGLTGRL